jgi:hypothetical protein
MRQLHADLWVAESPLRYLGLELGARMTVVRLPAGELLLHSPIAPTPELVQEVGALGPVAYLIAPNRFHHLFVADWQREFPHASIHTAPGVEGKRPDLSIAGVLGDGPDSSWASSLDQVLVRGVPMMNEVAFFHKESATLIATDLAFNIGPSSPRLTRAAFRCLGCYGRLSPIRLERILARDRAAFGQALTCVMDWPFERVIVAHGEISETGGREGLERGYGWALGRVRAASPE